MSVSLKPLGNNVVIQALEQEERTAFGIILPETAKEKPQKGVIVAVGPGRRLENGQRQEMALKVGDQVLYAKYAGTEIKMDGEEYLILSEDDVLSVIE